MTRFKNSISILFLRLHFHVKHEIVVPINIQVTEAAYIKITILLKNHNNKHTRIQCKP